MLQRGVGSMRLAWHLRMRHESNRQAFLDSLPRLRRTQELRSELKSYGA